MGELKLAIIPTIAGSGRRPLDGVPAQRLELIHSATSPTAKLLVDRRVIGEELVDAPRRKPADVSRASR